MNTCLPNSFSPYSIFPFTIINSTHTLLLFPLATHPQHIHIQSKEKKVRTKIKKIKEPRLFATSIDMVESNYVKLKVRSIISISSFDIHIILI
jgi:hypothetical protein